MTEHGVEFGESLNFFHQFFFFFDQSGVAVGASQRGDFHEEIFFVGEEFMERGIQETDGNGEPGHDFQDAVEIAFLHGKQFGKGGFAAFHGFGHDHFLHGGKTVDFHEHMLGSGETDAVSAEIAGFLSIDGVIGVGADIESADFVGPAEEFFEFFTHGRGDHGNFTGKDAAGSAVDGKGVVFGVGFTGDDDFLFFGVDFQSFGAADGGNTHAAGENRRVAGHAAVAGENTLSLNREYLRGWFRYG